LCGLYFKFLYVIESIDDAQSFLGYVFFDQYLLSHSTLFTITCTSVTGGIMINRRQL